MTRDELLIALQSLPRDARVMCSDGHNPAKTLIYNGKANEFRLVNASFAMMLKEQGDGTEVRVI